MIDLRDIKLFSKLDNKQIDKLKLISTQSKFKKDEILFYEGDEPKKLFVLLKGNLKIYKTNAKSNEVFLHNLYPVNFIAELANFENIPYPATAKFLTDGEVLKIDYEKFLSEFLSDKFMTLNLIKSLCNKLKILSEVLHNELILDSESKIAKFLVEHSEIFNMSKNVKIASLLNITPETLSRILSKFKNKGFISFDCKHKISLEDETSLRNIYE